MEIGPSTAVMFVISSLLHIVSATRLTLHYIDKALDDGAVCNDGSPGAYYLHEAPESTRWILFLEGGGACSSANECEHRWKVSRNLMSSRNYPNIIESRGLFDEPFLATYNKVVFVYCSSDSWLGNSLGNVTAPRSLNDSTSEFHFRGRLIFQMVVRDLAAKHGMDRATTSILAGSSGGAIGAANHVGTLKSILPRVEISLIIDSAWFINFNQYFTRQSSPFLSRSGIFSLDACRNMAWGMPCCLSMACMIGQGYIDPGVRILALLSKYDIYILFRDTFQNATTLKAKDVLLDVHAYGGQVMHSLEIVESYPTLSYVQTSCFQHVYLTTSNLWEDFYESVIEKRFPLLYFRHEVRAEHARTVRVKGNTINQYISLWIRGLHNESFRLSSELFSTGRSAYNSVLAREGNMHVRDTCLHAQCNPSCPQNLFFDADQTTWPAEVRIFMCALIAAIVVVCLLVKITWAIQHYSMVKAQRFHIETTYAGADIMKKIMCLPSLPPHSSIGIACSSLHYNLPNTVSDAAGVIVRLGSRRQRNAPVKSFRRRSEFGPPGKQILKGVSAYFNPGQLIAIMGPSGSGKTTLLDVLTARRHMKEAEASIFMNGLPADQAREWFIQNSGYVLQLATPYHPELTVRENLTYSALMRLPSNMTHEDKIWRVEQVIGQTGLFAYADVVVGGATGGGLSGGQKRRMCVALQLLDLPSVLFLDEPTSGLDSASSLELLAMLHSLTLSGRLVVVTIHQPRIEIFHMFDTILFICDGKAAFFGSPIMAPAMIAEALQGSGQVFDASNPADTIMDVLTNNKAQRIIVNHYNQSGEIDAINKAIERAKRHPQRPAVMDFKRPSSSVSNRLLALDGRSSASQTLAQQLYFPLVFLLYSVALGTCYWQTNSGALLLSCYMVFSCASQLFMASVINAHLCRALTLFSLEKADGFARSHELIIHTFIRMFSQTSVPLAVACGIIYLCTVRAYVGWKFVLTTLLHMQLNQAWISIIIFVACLAPKYCHLITPLLSAISGFSGGFLVPKSEMPVFYAWLFYVNPTHWAYAGIAKTLLANVSFECELNSKLECQENEGIVILDKFGIKDTNPYLSMTLLFVFLIVFIVGAIVVLEVRHTQLNKMWRNLRRVSLRRRLIVLRNSVRRCWYDFSEYRENKRKKKEEERRRLFDLCEQEYRYRSPEEAKTQDESPDETTPKCRHKVVTHDESPDETTPKRRRKFVTGFVRRKSVSGSEQSGTDSSDEDCKPVVHQVQAKKEALTQMKRQLEEEEAARKQKLRQERRANSCDAGFASLKHLRPTIRVQNCNSLPDINESSAASESSLAISKGEDEIAVVPTEDVRTKARKQGKARRRHRTLSDRDTWSRYLDTVPRPHEVYCSLVSVKRRLRSGGRHVKVALKRQRSMLMQTRVSSQLLEERRKSMKFQMKSFRFVLGDDDAMTSNDARRHVIMRAVNNAKRSEESRRNCISKLISMSNDNIKEIGEIGEALRESAVNTHSDQRNNKNENLLPAVNLANHLAVNSGRDSGLSVRTQDPSQVEDQSPGGETARLVIRSKRSSPLPSYRNSRDFSTRSAKASIEASDGELSWNMRRMNRLSRGALERMTTNDLLSVINKLDLIEKTQLSNVTEEDKQSTETCTKESSSKNSDNMTLSSHAESESLAPGNLTCVQQPLSEPAVCIESDRPTVESPKAVPIAASIKGSRQDVSNCCLAADATSTSFAPSREYDPLLPSERLFVESLLNKYCHWNRRLRPQNGDQVYDRTRELGSERYQYSTGVKIMHGSSANVSGEGSLKLLDEEDGRDSSRNEKASDNSREEGKASTSPRGSSNNDAAIDENLHDYEDDENDGDSAMTDNKRDIAENESDSDVTVDENKNHLSGEENGGDSPENEGEDDFSRRELASDLQGYSGKLLVVPKPRRVSVSFKPPEIINRSDRYNSVTSSRRRSQSSLSDLVSCSSGSESTPESGSDDDESVFEDEACDCDMLTGNSKSAVCQPEKEAERKWVRPTRIAYSRNRVPPSSKFKALLKRFSGGRSSSSDNEEGKTTYHVSGRSPKSPRLRKPNQHPSCRSTQQKLGLVANLVSANANSGEHLGFPDPRDSPRGNMDERDMDFPSNHSSDSPSDSDSRHCSAYCHRDVLSCDLERATCRGFRNDMSQASTRSNSQEFLAPNRSLAPAFLSSPFTYNEAYNNMYELFS